GLALLPLAAHLGQPHFSRGSLELSSGRSLHPARSRARRLGLVLSHFLGRRRMRLGLGEYELLRAPEMDLYGAWTRGSKALRDAAPRFSGFSSARFRRVRRVVFGLLCLSRKRNLGARRRPSLPPGPSSVPARLVPRRRSRAGRFLGSGGGAQR